MKWQCQASWKIFVAWTGCVLVQTGIFAGVPRTPSVFLIVFPPARQCGLPLEGGDGGDGGEPPRRSLSPGWRSGVLLGPSVLLVFEMPRPRLPRPSCGQRLLEFEQRLRKDRENRDDDMFKLAHVDEEAPTVIGGTSIDPVMHTWT